jgi:hypothetical protein
MATDLFNHGRSQALQVCRRRCSLASPPARPIMACSASAARPYGRAPASVSVARGAGTGGWDQWHAFLDSLTVPIGCTRMEQLPMNWRVPSFISRRKPAPRHTSGEIRVLRASVNDRAPWAAGFHRRASPCPPVTGGRCPATDSPHGGTSQFRPQVLAGVTYRAHETTSPSSLLAQTARRLPASACSAARLLRLSRLLSASTSG